MSNQKTEGTSRSESFFQSAAYRPFFPIIDEESLRRARLFAEEEKLAALIADDNGIVDQDTIYKIVAIARKVAKEGYPTTLVSVDDMLDIAQIFCFRDPNAARIEQELVLEDPQRPHFATRLTGTKFLNYAAELITGPDTHTASSLLVESLGNLDEKNNSAWTARVAAGLAYFSPEE